jgi:hypothetical protein
MACRTTPSKNAPSVGTTAATDVRSTIKSMRAGAKWNCQQRPDVWGEHCDDGCRRTPTTSVWIDKLKARCALAEHVRRQAAKKGASELAARVAQRLAICSTVAEKAGAPEHGGRTIFYGLQRWMAKELGTSQPSISRAIRELDDLGVVARVPRALMLTEFKGWRRRNGHAVFMKRMPCYFVLSVKLGENFSLSSSSDSRDHSSHLLHVPPDAAMVMVKDAKPALPSWEDEFRAARAIMTTETVCTSAQDGQTALDRLRAHRDAEKARTTPSWRRGRG